MGEKYEGTLLYSYNYLKNNENGGITNDDYIKDPEGAAEGGRVYESTNMPTVMKTATARNTCLLYTSRCV